MLGVLNTHFTTTIFIRTISLAEDMAGTTLINRTITTKVYTTPEGLAVPIGNHRGKTIVIGSDHRGVNYKEKLGDRIYQLIPERGYRLIDVGTSSAERCDYPVFSEEIGKEISASSGSGEFKVVGIGICGSGIGIIIPAGKYPGVYAARCLSVKDAEMSRRHNNANLLGIGADRVSLETALKMMDVWLEAPFYEDADKDEAYLRRFIQTRRLEQEIYK